MRRGLAKMWVVLVVLCLVGGLAQAGNGPAGFPLPKDAQGGGAAPGGGGKIVVYEIPRARDLVAKEVRALLAQDGWKIESDQASPRGSIRLVVSKADTTVRASIAGDPGRAALILTLP